MAENDTPPPKLQMDHGFMRSIIKNQVDRDEYDKQQRLQKLNIERKPARSSSSRSKRAPMAVYTPPAARARQQQENSPDGTDQDKNIAFKLEFLDNDDHVSSIIVHEGDDPKALSEAFGRQLGLAPSLRTALYHRIREEMLQHNIPVEDD